MNEHAIAIFCICDEIVKSYGFYENPANKLTTAEVDPRYYFRFA